MKNQLKSTQDIVDAIENIKSQIAFLGYVTSGLLARGEAPNPDSEPGQEIINGMSLVYDSLRDQVDELSKAMQENLLDVTEDEVRYLNKISGDENHSKRKAPGVSAVRDTLKDKG